MIPTPGAATLPPQVEEALLDWLHGLPDGEAFDAINGLRDFIHQLAPNQSQPVDLVRWVPRDMVEPNDYNPNAVARHEMKLLARSILHDGYTQPVVTVWDAAKNKFVIVDGFHRYFSMGAVEEIAERCHGYLPIVVLDKGINDRMAATVRHNRARGKHSVDGMANMVFQMCDNGMTDAEVCTELGLEPEELIRLKHITGFSKLFADAKYNRAWVTKVQTRIKAQYEAKAAEEKTAAPVD